MVAGRCFAALAACMALASCAAPVQPGIASLSEVAGAWDIAAFNGYRPQRLDSDGRRHAFVDIAADGELAFTIECNYSGMAGRVDDDGRLADASSENVYVTTAMGCGPERERRDEAFFRFFRAGPTLTRSGEDLVLATNSERLVLQRPEERRAAALPRSLEEISGRWRALIIYLESAPGHSRNLLASLEGAPAIIEFGATGTLLSFDCETIEAEVDLFEPGSLHFSAARRRVQGSCRIPEADRDLAASLISSAAEVENIDVNRVHLVSGSVRAVLERRHSASKSQ